MKHYYTELNAKGFKHTNKFSGFDSACAHFSTDWKPHSVGWLDAQIEAIELIGGQQVTHGWVDYTVGKTFEQTGTEKVTAMCPSHSEGHRSKPAFEEVI
jgi:hypothetical protein|tara:strand:+ start:368 stop:664 length:297 start_codon:yes stop_codon:yes gene_type:complete